MIALSRGWPGRRRRLDAAVQDRWQASLVAAHLDPGRLLAWAATVDGGHCLASAGVLSLSPADPATPDWRHIGWHRIERGGFDGDSLTLRWTLYGDDPYGSGPTDGEADQGQVVLDEPGRVPTVFQDRVAASIAVEQFFRLDPTEGRSSGSTERGVIVSGRRDLARRDAPLEWRASLPRGTRWDTPGIRELADQAIGRLRTEYDPAN